MVDAVSITSGYTESEAFYNPILWYDRPQAGMKRSVHQAALDAYSMMDTCASYYHQLQAPSVKYMKPEPVTYYHYADDAERYQSNIAVSAQNAPHSTFSSGNLTNYTPSHYASYTTATAAAAAAAAYTSLPTDSSSGFNLGHHVGTPSQVAHASDPQAVSPAQPSRIEEATITAPLTPPLSVSPVGGDSPTPHSTASHPSLPHTSGYREKDSAATYHHRSATASPCQPDCDSTTHSDHFLSEGEIIPKLPLHVLSDLSEGLPLPGKLHIHLPITIITVAHYYTIGSSDSESGTNNYMPPTSAALTAAQGIY